MEELIEGIKKKDVRSLAKAITLVENDHPKKLEFLSQLFPLQKATQYVGITGSPGAGKSTLVSRLISHIRSEHLTVAVIAVDPTSPFSGGALLGDRIRMNEHFTDEGVFIRSMATRGSLGGLSRATKDALRVCGAFGFDVVIVESVGVGQSELDIMKVVDTTAVVLTPNSGDVLQVFKAGIMEIADLFVINKADLDGVGKLRGLLKELVKMTDKKDYETAIVRTIASEGKWIDVLWEKITEHYHYLRTTGEGKDQRKLQLTLEIYDLIREEIWQDVKYFVEKEGLLSRLIESEDPYERAREILTLWKKEGGSHRDKY